LVQGFGLRPADDHGAYRYHGIGIEHLAFEVDRADEVDEAYERCIAAGGKIQSPPERHYIQDGEDYYASFAFDPDGIRIEVFVWPSSPYRTPIDTPCAQPEPATFSLHTACRIVGEMRLRARMTFPHTGTRCRSFL
jgi:hypothetical protein